MARYFGRWYIRSIPQVLYPKTEFQEAGASAPGPTGGKHPSSNNPYVAAF